MHRSLTGTRASVIRTHHLRTSLNVHESDKNEIEEGNDSPEPRGNVCSSAAASLWILMIIEEREGPEQTNEKNCGGKKRAEILCFNEPLSNPAKKKRTEINKQNKNIYNSKFPTTQVESLHLHCLSVAKLSPLTRHPVGVSMWPSVPLKHQPSPTWHCCTCVSVVSEPYRQIIDAPVPWLPRGTAREKLAAPEVEASLSVIRIQ